MSQFVLNCCAIVVVSVLLHGCSGGSGSSVADDVDPANNDSLDTPANSGSDELEQDQTSDGGEIGIVGDNANPAQQVPSEVADADRVALIIDAQSRCSIAGTPFDMRITRGLSDAELEAAGLTDNPSAAGFVTLTQSFGDSLQLLSRTDESVQFQSSQQDLVGLTASVDNGSVTAFLASFASDTPQSVVLQKPVEGGCLYALRLPNFCATGIARNFNLTFGQGDQSISAVGSELENPSNLPVIELAPFVQ